MTSPGYPETGTTDGGRILADEVAPLPPGGAAASFVVLVTASRHADASHLDLIAGRILAAVAGDRHG